MLTEKASKNTVIQVNHPETARTGDRVKITCAIISKDEMVGAKNVIAELRLKDHSEILALQSIMPLSSDHTINFILETPEVRANVEIVLSVKMDAPHGIIEEEIHSKILVSGSSEKTSYENEKPPASMNRDLFAIVKRNPSIPFLVLFGAFIVRSIIYYYDGQFSMSESFARYGYYVLFIAIVILLVKQFRSRKNAVHAS
jgi:hypothetical protein